MKKKEIRQLGIWVLAGMLIFSLSACGTSGAGKSNRSKGSVSVTKSDRQDDASTDSSKASTGTGNADTTSVTSADNRISDVSSDPVKAKIDAILKNPDDSVYFKPASDDYMYELDESYKIPKITLRSFDSDGNLIQYIERDESSKEMPDQALQVQLGVANLSSDRMVRYIDLTESMEDLGWCKENEKSTSRRTVKYDWEIGRYGKAYDGLVYMSKGLSVEDTHSCFANNEANIFQFEVLKELAEKFGSDYMIVANDDVEYHAPEYDDTYPDFLRIGEYTLSGNNIYVFDESGNLTTALGVVCLNSADEIQEWLYFHLGEAVDYETMTRKFYKQNSYSEFMATHTVYKNAVYDIHTSSPYKWDTPYSFHSADSKIYFSVPYLTQKQLDEQIKQLKEK